MTNETQTEKIIQENTTFIYKDNKNFKELEVSKGFIMIKLKELKKGEVFEVKLKQRGKDSE